MAATLAGALLLVLTGCGELRNALGMGKNSPDEFAVVRHAALAVPPDFDLRPPAPGAPRPQEVSPREDARKTLLGQGAGGAAAGAKGASALLRQTPGEGALLRQSGAGETPVNIREVVRIEAAALGAQDRTFTDRLLFWKKSEEGEVLDPAAEADRLRRAKQGAKPAATPSGVVIKRKKGGLLGDLF